MLDLLLTNTLNLCLLKKVSETAVIDFRSECLKFFVTMAKRLQTKSPLSYGLVRNMACLDTRKIYEQHELNNDRFRRVLSVLLSCGRLNENECDDIQTEYDQFVDESKHLKGFRSSQG